MEGLEPFKLTLSFFLLTISEVRTHCERTQQTGEFVLVVDCGLTNTSVNDWRSPLWLHSIPSVLLQVLRLRKLRCGLHEEGRRADDVTSLTEYFSDVLSIYACLLWFLNNPVYPVHFDSNPNLLRQQNFHSYIISLLATTSSVKWRHGCVQITAEHTARQE